MVHMPHHKIQVEPAQLEDLERLAGVQQRAFSAVPVSIAMFGRVAIPDQETSILIQLKKMMDSPSSRVYKAVIGAQVVGVGAFDIPKNKSLIQEEEEPRSWSNGTDVELAESFFSEMARRDSLLKEAHYHYHIIGVEPSFHNRGIGAALLQVAIEMSNLDGRQLFLDATEQGVPLYLKNGFKYFGDPLVVGKNLEYKLDPMVYTPINCLEAAGL